ncbi:MAG: tetratricopeptide repeat protein, partial [Robiginitalea sp.]
MKGLLKLLTFLVLFCNAGLAQQQQQIADSLRPIYLADTVQGTDRMKLLEDLAYHEMNDPDQALAYADELIALAREAGDNFYLFGGYFQKGHTLFIQNNLDKALEAYQTAMQIAQGDRNKEGEAKALMYQGFVYSDSGEPDRAIDYVMQGIALLRDPEVQNLEGGESLLAAALINLGNIHMQENELEKAAGYFEEAEEIYRRLNSRSHLKYVLGNQGMIYARLGDLSKAEENLNEAIRLLEEDENYAPIAEYQITLAEVYRDSEEFDKAHGFADQGLEHAQRLGLKELISRGSLVLAELDYQSENYKEAFQHQAMYMQYKDSMDVETVDMNRLERAQAEMEALRVTNELEVKELQQKSYRTALWAVGVTALLLIIIAVGSLGRYRYMRKTNKIISAERDRSEELLLNILPKDTAQELKDNGHVLAKRFESVTVLFTDFKGFTAHAESLDPEKLVESIDLYFSNFDAIMEKHGLEKIKTVGDAYMCASGLPFPSEDHAHRMAEAALELIE